MLELAGHDHDKPVINYDAQPFDAKGINVSKGPKTHHVVPNPKGGWNVKRGGAKRASSCHATKRDAINRARVISRNQNTELRIHNRDGEIARSDSHGNDPYPPKG